MGDNDQVAPLFAHFEALRNTLVQCLCIVLAGCVLCFAFVQPIIAWFTAPLYPAHSLLEEQIETVQIFNPHPTTQTYHLPPAGAANKPLPPGIVEIAPDAFQIPPNGGFTYALRKPQDKSLVLLGPLEGMKIALKTAFFVGLILTAPLWGFCVARFLSPGLREAERRAAIPFLLTSVGFIAIGGMFAYGVTIPLANTYLMQFNASLGVNLWSLSHYLDYSLFLLIANGAAFQLAAIGLFAVHYRVVTADALLAHRRGAIVAAFILGALLTPPDVATQILLAIPLIALYESVILYAKLRRV